MIGRLTVFVTGLVIGLVMTLAWPSQAHASKCEAGTVFNPITKVRWTCIFPITVGGIRVGSFDKLDKALDAQSRSEEHTSELQSLMRTSYAVFCLKKTNTLQSTPTT